MNLAKKLKTKYTITQVKDVRNSSGRWIKSKIRLETEIDGWQACKKENGLWVMAYKMFNHTCPNCGHDTFEIWGPDSDDRKMKIVRCVADRVAGREYCDYNTVLNGFDVPTPDQAIGRWVKVGGKWCVRIVSGTVGDEVIVISKNGPQIKKVKNIKIVQQQNKGAK